MAVTVPQIAPARCGASSSADPSASAGSRHNGCPPVRTGSSRPGPLSMQVYGRLAGGISTGGFTWLRGMSVLWRERLGLTAFITRPMDGDLARGRRRRRGRRRERLCSCGWSHGSAVSVRVAILLLVLVRVVRAAEASLSGVYRCGNNGWSRWDRFKRNPLYREKSVGHEAECDMGKSPAMAHTLMAGRVCM